MSELEESREYYRATMRPKALEYILIIKGNPVAAWQRVVGEFPSRFSYSRHLVQYIHKTDETAILIGFPLRDNPYQPTIEGLLNTWLVEDKRKEPPFESGSLLWWYRLNGE